MKTDEFRRKLMNLADFFIGEGEEWTKISYNSALVAEIKNSNMPKVIFYSVPFRQMVDICLDYAETPPKDREFEKRYMVFIPDVSNTYDRKCMLINKASGIGIGFAFRSDWESFTEAEIKENHAYLWHFADEVK